MGKPFSKELEQLGQTYSWALEADIDSSVMELKRSYSLPFLAVGSGGSYSAAELQATLHRYFFSSIAIAVTPVEMISALPRDGKASVWVLSASGNNIDIRRAFQHAALMEPKSVNALVGRKKSKISQLQKRYQYTNVYEFPMPAGKDGFLASNSLMGFAVLLYRIYLCASETEQALPSSLQDLFRMAVPGHADLRSMELALHEVCKKRTVHVVYSDRYKSVAVDIESKFVEAGLGSVHLADSRNFAHGRHHWFDKNPDDSAILFLSSEQDRDLAERTLNLLPENLAKQHLTLADVNGLELVAGILISLHLTQWRGTFFGIDPGRPGVPQYGSKIYRLSANSGFISSISKEKVASTRKLKVGPRNTDVQSFEQSYRKFVRRISKQCFNGLVLDYDGTLVDSRDRGNPPCVELCQELNRLLAGGLTIGFATGRGKSIRTDLQSSEAIEKQYWDKVVIGYYNGAEIGYLSDNTCPKQTTKHDVCFDGVIQSVGEVFRLNKPEMIVTPRKFQITVETKEPMPEVLLWDIVCGAVENLDSDKLYVTRSSHSVDILPRKVSKKLVVETVESTRESNGRVLTIGDRGRWPGNDSALLSTDFSLSVDEVSSATNSCWNLCPAGVRGPQGTLHYLRRIECYDGTAYFR